MDLCVTHLLRRARFRAAKPQADERRGRRALVCSVLALAAVLSLPHVSRAEDAVPAAWRVECVGDGKVLDCRALQHLVSGENKQTIAILSVRVPADSKVPNMLIQLPLGIALVEPVQLQVDGGPTEKQSVQTCTAGGCFLGVPLNDKLLAAMRSGKVLKLTFQDTNKRSLSIDVPLLGFGLALDKVK
jgi:invasion protein IalB